jgi:hypothetical protein
VREPEPYPVAALAGGGDLLAKQGFQERHVRQLLGAGCWRSPKTALAHIS